MAKEELKLYSLQKKGDVLTFLMQAKGSGKEKELNLQFVSDAASEFFYNMLSWALQDDSIFGDKLKDGDTLNEVDIKKAAAKGTKPYMLCQGFLQMVTEAVDKERDVQYYAKRLGVTPSYLFVVVKEFTDKSPSDIIASFVISNAKQLLERTNMNCKQITKELNFPNQSFFGKFFKKHTGMTPMDYRKKNRNIL